MKLHIKPIQYEVETSETGARVYRIAGETGEYHSVTTVIGRVVNKPGLNDWRVAVGAEESDRRRAEAAEIGKMIHDRIRRLVRGEPIGPYEWANLGYPDASDERVRNGLRAYQRFKLATGYQPLAAEVFVYSRRYNYAGRLDSIGTIGDGLVLPDWKSSDYLYPETWFQLAAYAVAFEELYGYPIAEVRRVRLDRTSGLQENDSRDGPGIWEAFDAYLGVQSAYRFLQRNGG